MGEADTSAYPVSLDPLLRGYNLIRVTDQSVLCVWADRVTGLGILASVREFGCGWQLLCGALLGHLSTRVPGRSAIIGVGKSRQLSLAGMFMPPAMARELDGWV